MQTTMSAKIVVHKYESNDNFKSLQIIFEDGDNGSCCKTRYSEWADGKTQKKKKDAQNSRLVVKIVSENEFKIFNLDSCAKEVNYQEFNISYHRNGFTNVKNERVKGCMNIPSNISPTYQQDITKNSMINNYENYVNPLEYSLEKVKENNARIMENIHMLNRTLNYTKQKEILDIVCPNSMGFPCNSCGKCFVYKTGLKRHCSISHTMSAIQPRWQIVWTCTECFQVWPQLNLALDHSSQCCKIDTVDCVREIKTSSLLQCEFCEKVFTSIPRLLGHSKMHTTTNNYECNACKSWFSSYKSAEQHWLLCPWMKMYYSFSLPKMLLCNACDRKFRNYEQLYNHRYKVGHFMMKTHCSQGGVEALGTLVYQCETCAQWFNSTSMIQAHRRQNHSGYESYRMQYNNDSSSQGYENTYYEPNEHGQQVNQMDMVHQQYM